MSSAPQPAFAKVPSQVSLPAIEHGILALWTTLDAFQESNRRRQAAGASEFVFYDGPPFATGTPHYGHLLAGTIKDIVPRYWTMRGRHVERRFGWDCHGLPIENLAQKTLGLNGTPEIRAHGVDRFNEQCRSMVLQYVNEWRKTVTRMGRWVDFDRDYKTMDRDFMESVWWVFKRLWDQGMVYKAYRIMPYSWKLTTPLSNFEAGNNYKDVQDPAITIRFRVRKSGSPEVAAAIAAGNAFVLAWTTTPWTLPGNLALCVGPAITYAWIRDAKTGDVYLIAQDRLSAYYKKAEEYTILAEQSGVQLIGLAYEPLFPYFADQPNAFRLVGDAFVTTGDGTGIVHLAPAYGEDDYRVCRREGIDLVDPLDEEAKFTAKVHEYAGQFCKDADKAIIKRLVLGLFPLDKRDRAHSLWDEIEARLGGWTRGQLLLMLVIGVLSAVGYSLIGLDFWLALGIWAGITEIIPFIGPFLGGTAAVTVALTQSWEKAVIVLVFVILLQQLEGAFLVPRVMRAYEAALVRHIEELAGARDAVAWDRVSRIAHTLKSSSASVGALGLSRRCAEVEGVLRAGPPPQPWPALDELIGEARQVLAAVRAMLVS